MSRHCLICTALTRYAHYGIDSCRSCADFYQRTLKAGRTFICRQGERKCVINQKDRHNCRGCRFERCKQLGMRLPEDSPLERSTSHQRLPGISRIHTRERSKSLDPSNDRSISPLVRSSSPYFPLQPSVPHKDDLLSRVSNELRKSVARRKAGEIELQQSALKRNVLADFQRESFLLCSWSFLVECLKLFAADYMIFASTCFPRFNELCVDDQNLMLKNFAARLYTAETHSNTFKMFMATLTTVFDARKFHFFTEEEVPASTKDIVEMMDYYTERTIALVGPILAKSRFTGTEYAVLFALSLWIIDPSENLNDHIINLSYEMRRSLFDALTEYYREELGLDDYSVRLGNLMSYEHAIQESTVLLNEEIQAYTLTGMLDEDVQFFKDVMTIPF